MKPIKLSMTAFGPYAGNQVIDFRELQDRNFFLIHGPTGAGKTTILDVDFPVPAGIIVFFAQNHSIFFAW